ncbi:MAG: AAA family ATPase [Desulfatibacillaceae bacterium]
MHIDKLVVHNEKFPGVDRYPFNLEVLQRTPEVPFDSPVTFFIGENGTGKSTLLRAMCIRAGIHIWEGRFTPRAEHNPYEKSLYQAVSVRWSAGRVPGSFFGSELFRNFSKLVDEWAASDPGVLEYYGGRSLLSQSHGQSLMAYFKARFSRRGVFLLDEPETALSPRSQIGLLRLLHEAGERGAAQFVVATHSPILMACPGAAIWSFDHVPVRRLEYRETDHYRLYRDFLNSPEGFLGL